MPSRSSILTRIKASDTTSSRPCWAHPTRNPLPLFNPYHVLHHPQSPPAPTRSPVLGVSCSSTRYQSCVHSFILASPERSPGVNHVPIFVLPHFSPDTRLLAPRSPVSSALPPTWSQPQSPWSCQLLQSKERLNACLRLCNSSSTSWAARLMEAISLLFMANLGNQSFVFGCSTQLPGDVSC